MKNTRRAVRRHHRQRMIARTLKMHVFYWIEPEDRLSLALHLYKNRKKCSCSMCGQRRKWCGLTVQERRQEKAEKLPLFSRRSGIALEAEASEEESVADMGFDDQDWNEFCRADLWSPLNGRKQTQVVESIRAEILRHLLFVTRQIPRFSV